ncbi:MAG: DUF21 domain-containing protein [Rhodobacteraceae bacterium]|nr:DUF21 domain-containing protein [Paracoccaceae bacterium]
MENASLALDAAFWITVAAIVALLLMSAFFSGSETALTAASRGKLRSQADRGSRGAARALKITDDNERLIGSVLLGNNIVNILAASLATALFTRLFGDNGVAMATLVMTALVLVFAEVLPKTYAITNAERAASLVAPVISLVVLIFAPVVTAVRALVRGILGLFGVSTDPDSQILAVREEIAGALSIGHAEGVVEKEDRDRILGALDLADRAVEEIMLHRSNIEMVDADEDAQAILEQCLNSLHSRLPVFRGERDNIVGVIHAKDLLRSIYARGESGNDTADAAKLDIKAVAMEPYFVPETTTLDDQMRQFLRLHTHFALVVDEYGALQGLITLEDILEEIVGEITDEFDIDEDHPLRQTEAGDYVVDGAMTIRDLNRATEWSLPDEEANTIAGLVIHEAQTIPSQGQVFSFHGFRFEVAARQDQRITRLKIRPL